MHSFGDAPATAGHFVRLVKDTGTAAAAMAAIAAPAAIPYWLANTNNWLLALMPGLGFLAMIYLVLGRRAYLRYWENRNRRSEE